jgi:hypothetical protein
MVGYRCYILDAADHIVQAYDLDCETDAQAETTAKGLLAQDPYHRWAEVWRATCRVARMEREVTHRLRLMPEEPAPGRELGSVI